MPGSKIILTLPRVCWLQFRWEFADLDDGLKGRLESDVLRPRMHTYTTTNSAKAEVSGKGRNGLATSRRHHLVLV